MHHSRTLSLTFLALLLALAAGPVFAASAFAAESNDLTTTEKSVYPRTFVGSAQLICILDRPSQVQRYFVTCSDATQLDVAIADCCISGDHWEAKSKIWDAQPNTAVTTSPGPANVFGVRSRVYTYGGTPFQTTLRAEVDCSYLHGVNVFPAGSFINLFTDGTCTIAVQDLGKRDEINRTP